MASEQSFRWRTVFEVGVISVVIYVLLGAPGLPLGLLLGTSSSGQEEKVPVSQAKLESLVYPSQDLQCPAHHYAAHVFSTTPLVIYVDGFLSDTEADHLVDIR